MDSYVPPAHVVNQAILWQWGIRNFGQPECSRPDANPFWVKTFRDKAQLSFVLQELTRKDNPPFEIYQYPWEVYFSIWDYLKIEDLKAKSGFEILAPCIQEQRLDTFNLLIQSIEINLSPKEFLEWLNCTDSDSKTLFHIAIAVESIDFVRQIIPRLIQLGCTQINTSGYSYGFTPLIQSIGRGDPAYFECLIAHGADPTVVSKFGMNLLHRACNVGTCDEEDEDGTCDDNLEMVRAVINLPLAIVGPMINAQDKGGRTPLMMALEISHFEVAEYLIEWCFQNSVRLDLSLRDKKEQTPFMLAAMMHNEEMMKRLLTLYPEGLDVPDHRGMGVSARLSYGEGWDKYTYFHPEEDDCLKIAQALNANSSFDPSKLDDPQMEPIMIALLNQPIPEKFVRQVRLEVYFSQSLTMKLLREIV